jgi:hypothetical protein
MQNFKKATPYAFCVKSAAIILSLLTIIGSICLHGCGKGTVVREQVTFNIIPDTRINDERPVYLVIRKVNRTEFLVENYDGISEMVHANPPSETVLALHMLLPGQKEMIQVLKPEKIDIGVYVLFTNPGDNWKIILENPLKLEYHIKVKSNYIEEYHKGFLW